MTDEEVIRLAMQGKIIRCCADCACFNKHKCQLGHNKESDPRDRFFDDCSLEDLECHDAEIRKEAIDEFMNKALAMIKAEQDTRYGYLDCMDIREIAGKMKEQKEC